MGSLGCIVRQARQSWSSCAATAALRARNCRFAASSAVSPGRCLPSSAKSALPPEGNASLRNVDSGIAAGLARSKGLRPSTSRASTWALPVLMSNRTHLSSPASQAACKGVRPCRSARLPSARASSSCCASTTAEGERLDTAAARAVDPSSARSFGSSCCFPTSHAVNCGNTARAAYTRTVLPASSRRSAGTPSVTSHSASTSFPASQAHMAAERPPGARATSEASKTSTRAIAKSL
mmetsp:Transcript_23545/g.65456  ORF Transcript_23545/g.65456 Transcript_23545/m.65456 type:complete len:237 (-) Transcript_23545:851-1561(-)